MGKIINGPATAAAVRAEVRQQVAAMNRKPQLAVIHVGDDARSATYVRNKKKACEEAGIGFLLKKYKDTVKETTVINQIRKYNRDPEIDGIIIQLPLPAHLDETRIIEAVDPDKDVDGLTRRNIVRLYNNENGLVPATPAGIMKLLESIGCDVDGKHVVIVGRGRLVGHPLSLLMLNANATVTVCHSHTRNLAEITRTADILVVGIGRAGFITADYIKEGAVVIDAGINVTEEGKLKGDCDFEGMLEKASWITPVPKGVGPMTVAMLLANVLKACEMRK